MGDFKNLLGVAGYVFVVGFILGALGVRADLEISQEVDDVSIPMDEDISHIQIEDLHLDDLKIDDLQADDLEKEDLQEILDAVQRLFVSGKGNGCSCRGLSCSCCARIRIKFIKGNLCLQAQIVPRDFGIVITLKFGRRTLYRKEVSARRPPPICVKLPFLKKAGSACINFYDVSFDRRSVRLCANLQVKVFGKSILKTRLGCFRLSFVQGEEVETAVQSVEFPDEKESEEESESVFIQPLNDFGENRGELL